MAEDLGVVALGQMTELTEAGFRTTQQMGEGSQMFPLPLGHLLGKAFKVDFRESLLGPFRLNCPICRAFRRFTRDTEGLVSGSAICCAREDLRDFVIFIES